MSVVVAVFFLLFINSVHMGVSILGFVGVLLVKVVEGEVTSWFFIDSVSGFLVVLTLLICVFMQLSVVGSSGKMASGISLGLCWVLVVSFLVKSFILFYVFFEFSLLPTFFLVLSLGYQPERYQAGMYLMMYTVCASLPLLLAILALFNMNGEVSFLSMKWVLTNGSVGGWWVMLMLAFFVKTPVYSVHLWLPKAHVEAPVIGSMVLAGVLLKLGGYGMMRVVGLMQELGGNFFFLSCGIVLWGVVISSMICLRQSDLKALIAYSSVTHMGLVVCGIMSNSVFGWFGALMMMLAHGLVSSSMFLLANECYGLVGSRSVMLVKGLLGISPLVSVLWFISLGMNMGAPPSINLQGELMLVMSVVNFSYFLGFPIMLSLVLSVAYCFCVYVMLNHGSSDVRMKGGVLSSRIVLCVLLHLFPVFFFFIKSELIMM